MDERAAVERLKAGDAGGLEPLVRAHHARAVRAAYLVVRDRSVAEDVVQGAFLKACEGIGGFDEGRPFGPWFMRVVLNEAAKASKRRGRAASREVKGAEELLLRLADPEAGPHLEAEKAEARRRVWAALEQLPPAQRAAVVERYYLGMSESEMAEHGGVAGGTIKSRLHNARKGLARLLRPRSRGEDVSAIRGPGRPLVARRGFPGEEERP